MIAVAGLHDPVHDAQRIFRTVLDAMSHPAQALRLAGRNAGLDGHTGAVPPALAATLLSLADFETPVWLHPQLADELGPLLRFHAGTPLVTEPRRAAFAVARAAELPPLKDCAWGSAEYPDRSTTLLIAVDALAGGASLLASGPGIAAPLSFAPRGLASDFWQQRREMQREFPLGVDCLLFDRDSIAALPRTTIVIDDAPHASASPARPVHPHDIKDR